MADKKDNPQRKKINRVPHKHINLLFPLSFAVLVLAIPLFVVLGQQKTVLRQHAQVTDCHQITDPNQCTSNPSPNCGWGGSCNTCLNIGESCTSIQPQTPTCKADGASCSVGNECCNGGCGNFNGSAVPICGGSGGAAPPSVNNPPPPANSPPPANPSSSWTPKCGGNGAACTSSSQCCSNNCVPFQGGYYCGTSKSSSGTSGGSGGPGTSGQACKNISSINGSTYCTSGSCNSGYTSKGSGNGAYCSSGLNCCVPQAPNSSGGNTVPPTGAGFTCGHLGLACCKGTTNPCNDGKSTCNSSNMCVANTSGSTGTTTGIVNNKSCNNIGDACCADANGNNPYCADPSNSAQHHCSTGYQCSKCDAVGDACCVRPYAPFNQFCDGALGCNSTTHTCGLGGNNINSVSVVCNVGGSSTTCNNGSSCSVVNGSPQCGTPGTNSSWAMPLIVLLQGILSNQNLTQPQKDVVLKFITDVSSIAVALNASNKVLGAATYTVNGKLTYDKTSGKFINNNFKLDNIPPGRYQIIVQATSYLDEQLLNANGSKVFTLATDQPINAASTTLIPGDVVPAPHGNNIIDLLDYSWVATTCINKSAQGLCASADLNIDGIVDQKDVDLLLPNVGKQGFFIQSADFSCVQDQACVENSQKNKTLMMCPLICANSKERG